MIEYDYNTANQNCVCKSEKLLTEVYIEKELGGYKFFKLRYGKGLVPQELSGRYTSVKAAQKALENYLKKKPVSKTKQVKERADQREKERNAAKSKSKGS